MLNIYFHFDIDWCAIISKVKKYHHISGDNDNIMYITNTHILLLCSIDSNYYYGYKY